MSRLENNCLEILSYSSKQKGRWVTIKELSEALNIPNSTLKDIFRIAYNGYFIKYDKCKEKTSIHQDVFQKIAYKYHYNYKIKKIMTENKKMAWAISVVFEGYGEKQLNEIYIKTNNIYE